MESATKKLIENALDTVRPFLKADGGDVEVVDITQDNIVKVRLLGACEHCPTSKMTMKAGIEETIKKAVPQIKAVEAVSTP